MDHTLEIFVTDGRIEPYEERVTGPICLFPEITEPTDYPQTRHTETVYEGDTLLSVDTAYTGVFEVAENTKRIGKYAFCDCASITEIILPKGLLEIEKGAFCGCGQLSRIRIPSGIRDIPESAFEDCVSLHEVTLPDRIHAIGRFAFFHCVSLYRIKLPNELETVGEFAFKECLALKRLDFPRSVRRIPRGCALDAGALEAVTLPQELEEIGERAFKACRSLRTLSPLPSRIVRVSPDAFLRTPIRGRVTTD